MKGIYVEYANYDIEEVSQAEIQALRTLGVKVALDYGMRKLKIVQDTAILKHDKCELRE